ncbi:MAG: hypothetical protein KAS32_24570 [Candidatus Peribacteraceae bacterium]|nr:hypothetical protein [Candidatus Peribacteraceae bacterium]
MKKLSFVSLACLVIVSCTPAQEFTGEILPSDVVMQNAATASLSLNSFEFNANANFKTNKIGKEIDGNFIVEGRSDSEGEQMALNINADIAMDLNNVKNNFIVDAEIIVLGPDEVYFLLNSFNSNGGSNDFLPAELINILVGKWWSLGSTISSKQGNITPDPKLLNAQAQVVRIEKEYPITLIDGSYNYHYSVVIDTDKLIDFLEEISQVKEMPFNKEKEQEKLNDIVATGELWIDAKTFITKKIVWNISSKENTGEDDMQANINVTFSNWGNVEPISPPEDAKVFNPASLLESLTGENIIDGFDSDVLNSLTPNNTP